MMVVMRLTLSMMMMTTTMGIVNVMMMVTRRLKPRMMLIITAVTVKSIKTELSTQALKPSTSMKIHPPVAGMKLRQDRRSSLEPTQVPSPRSVKFVKRNFIIY